jgi:hypothetical protein
MPPGQFLCLIEPKLTGHRVSSLSVSKKKNATVLNGKPPSFKTLPSIPYTFIPLFLHSVSKHNLALLHCIPALRLATCQILEVYIFMEQQANRTD